MPFLSLLDDRAKPKGSRDPLGFELVWSHFGRKVIGNLTTITSSMDNFAVALLGFYWANHFATLKTDDYDRHKHVREMFLRYEQLTGYIRYCADAADIMGITRIKRRMDDNSFRITLGQSTEQQILSDQASYGLWGLYSSAARESGLISSNNRVLEDKGQRIVDVIIDQLGDTADAIKELLISHKPVDKSQLYELAVPFMKAVHHENVQQQLLEALMTGKQSGGVQSELWSITRLIFKQKKAKPETLIEFINQILMHDPSKHLTQCIHDIIDIERLLVAANNLFHYCRRMDGEKLEDILKELDGKYLYDYLPKKLPDDDFPKRAQLVSILDAFHNNELARVLGEIFQLNKEVMQQRSGAPWVELEAGKTLHIKVKSETAELKKQSDLEQKWDYDYFLGSFFYIANKQLSQA